jgi:hypothetical protein
LVLNLNKFMSSPRINNNNQMNRTLVKCIYARCIKADIDALK